MDLRGQKAVDNLYREREESWYNAHPGITDEQIEKKRISAIKGTEALKKYREEIRK